ATLPRRRADRRASSNCYQGRSAGGSCVRRKSGGSAAALMLPSSADRGKPGNPQPPCIIVEDKCSRSLEETVMEWDYLAPILALTGLVGLLLFLLPRLKGGG